MLNFVSLLLVLSLSEERLVAPATYAAANARVAATATNGRSQLVAWASERNEVFVQLLDDSLALRMPEGVLLGRVVGEVQLGGVASDGDGYLVAWGNERQVWLTHVSAAGETARPRLLAEAGTDQGDIVAPQIASNGRGYLATWVERRGFMPFSGSRVMGRMLDRTSAPVGDAFPIKETPTFYVHRIRLASNGNGYLAEIDCAEQGAGYRTELVRIADRVGIPRATDHPFYVEALTFDGTSYVVAASRQLANSRDLYVSTVTNDGEIVLWRKLATVHASMTIETLVSNGNGSLIVLRREDRAAPMAMRMAPGGNALDVAPRALPVTTLPMAVIAGAAPEGKYFVSGLAPLAGARIPSSLDAEILIEPQPVALAPVPQRQPRVVPIASGHVVAFIEGTTLRANGAVLTNNVRSYALATNGTRALIAWSDTAVRGRYIDAAGQMSEPFVIDPHPYSLYGAVAAGGGFGVIWRNSGLIYKPVGGGDARPLELPVYANSYTEHRDPALVPTAAGFLLVYQEVVNDTRTAIRARAFRADGTPAGLLRTISDTIHVQSAPAVATDGAGHLVAAWHTLSVAGGSDEVHVAPIAEDGSVIGEERVLGLGTRPRLSWNGTEFAVVNGVLAGAVSRDGEVLLPLTPLLGFVEETTIGGRTIAYVRDGLVFTRMTGDVRRRATR